MIPWMIWRKQGRVLCFSDVMFTCQGKLGEFMHVSKLASTFVLALVEKKSTPLNFWHFSTHFFLKILAKQSKTAKKWVHFTVELFNLVCIALVLVTRSNRCLSKVASILSLLSSKGFLLHCILSNFLHRLPWRFWRIGVNRRKIFLFLTASLFSRPKTGGLGQVTTKKNRVLLDPVLTAK